MPECLDTVSAAAVRRSIWPRISFNVYIRVRHCYANILHQLLCSRLITTVYPETMGLSLGLSIPLRSVPAFKVRHSVLRSLRTPPSCARAFSTTLQRDANWGFIGLGQMGMSCSFSRGPSPSILLFVNKDLMRCSYRLSHGEEPPSQDPGN